MPNDVTRAHALRNLANLINRLVARYQRTAYFMPIIIILRLIAYFFLYLAVVK